MKKETYALTIKKSVESSTTRSIKERVNFSRIKNEDNKMRFKKSSTITVGSNLTVYSFGIA